MSFDRFIQTKEADNLSAHTLPRYRRRPEKRGAVPCASRCMSWLPAAKKQNAGVSPGVLMGCFDLRTAVAAERPLFSSDPTVRTDWASRVDASRIALAGHRHVEVPTPGRLGFGIQIDGLGGRDGVPVPRALPMDDQSRSHDYPDPGKRIKVDDRDDQGHRHQDYRPDHHCPGARLDSGRRLLRRDDHPHSHIDQYSDPRGQSEQRERYADKGSVDSQKCTNPTAYATEHSAASASEQPSYALPTGPSVRCFCPSEMTILARCANPVSC